MPRPSRRRKRPESVIASEAKQSQHKSYSRERWVGAAFNAARLISVYAGKQFHILS
jgi:hypothetical protein